jgi:hypothetical protein
LLVRTLLQPLHPEVVDADARDRVLLEEPQPDPPDLIPPRASKAADEMRRVSIRDVVVLLEPLPPNAGLGDGIAVMADEERAGAEADDEDSNDREDPGKTHHPRRQLQPAVERRPHHPGKRERKCCL